MREDRSEHTYPSIPATSQLTLVGPPGQGQGQVTGGTANPSSFSRSATYPPSSTSNSFVRSNTTNPSTLSSFVWCDYVPPTYEGLPHINNDAVQAKMKMSIRLPYMKELFQFPQLYIEEPAPSTLPIDDLDEEEEPEVGLFPEWFDVNGHNEERRTTKNWDRIPHCMNHILPPMRPLEHIPLHERLEHFSQLQSFESRPELITYICIANIEMQKAKLVNLGGTINQFQNAEVVILRGLELQKIDDCRLPRMRYLDMSHNKIESMSAVLAVVQASPDLEVVNFVNNPVAARAGFCGRLIAACPYLEVLNEKTLTVTERIAALESYGKKQMRADLPLLRWDLAMDTLPEVRQMLCKGSGWEPHTISSLTLTSCGLTTFSVSTLLNLLHLDLSANQISDLRCTGLEKCNVLSHVNMKYNKLSKRHNLRVFALVPSLQSVSLGGNKLSAKKHYRLQFIFETRNLRSNNRSQGLEEIDGMAVTLDERVEAVEIFGDSRKHPHDSPQAVRWHHTLISAYGHKQLRSSPAFAQRVKVGLFSNRLLGFAQVGMFQSLEVLNLSSNVLVTVDGLDKLSRIRVLDLSENPKLKTKHVLQQLAHTTSLESFSFYVSNPGNHKRAPQSKSCRANLVKTLAFSNRALALIDSIMLGLDERVDAYRSIGASAILVEKYRFHLSLVFNCTMPIYRRYHFDEVANVDNQLYDPQQITGLRRLRGCGLVSDACDFSKFHNLVELDLSFNKLTDITSLGLQNLPLRVLCVHNNDIRTPLVKIAEFVDGLRCLEVLTIRENPVMRGSDERMKLMGYLKCLRVPSPTLQVLDCGITLPERVEAWRRAGGTDQECEVLRFWATLKTIILPNTDYHLLNVLDMSESDISAVDFAAFVNLQTLVLSCNRIDSMESITSITHLKSLEVLDLRYNHLCKIDAVVGLVESLPILHTLGLVGNKFSKDATGYRVKFLSLVQGVYTTRGHPLCVLDGSMITIDERAIASKLGHNGDGAATMRLAGTITMATNITMGGSAMAKGMRWSMCLLRKLPPSIPFDQITEADFSHCLLSSFDVILLPRLVKLSVAYNKIKEGNLEKSNLETLSGLRMLNLRGNKLRNLDVVCECLDRLSSHLEVVFVDENPCYTSDNGHARTRFFKKMKRLGESVGANAAGTGSGGVASAVSIKTLNGLAVSSHDLVMLGQSKKKRGASTLRFTGLLR